MRQQQGMSQSTGYNFPQKQKVKLALGSTHRECYLPGIVVVILCPVWQCINEQHANTFCRNICDRHIFRLPSKSEKREKKMFSISRFLHLKVCGISLADVLVLSLSFASRFSCLLKCFFVRRTQRNFLCVAPKDEMFGKYEVCFFEFVDFVHHQMYRIFT